ncbi:MAG TPA: FAD-dependent thymidylate synthase [Candidatus Limnocylindria bacterium]|nr:FAD-dependent thymidylate synthase [Candidatus Limnocylindria bacterium]
METRRPTNPAAEEILGRYFPALDHGFVALVDYMGSDEDVERAARVSYGYGTRRSQETRGLIRYLRRHRHTTPSEMVELKFHCAMPMFVARQWIRHRMSSVNEYSGRYSLIPQLFYLPAAEHLQAQSQTNRQGRGGAALTALHPQAVERWTRLREQAAATYEWLVGEDVARELARIDLPLSTYTQWYWKIDLHNLFHFLSLRADPHAQYEIRVYARLIAGMVKRVAPLSFEAWFDYEYGGAHLSRAELAALRTLVGVAGEDLVGTAKRLSAAELVALGLAKREADELREKLTAAPAIDDFDLDLAASVSPEHFAARLAEAVPRVDRP